MRHKNINTTTKKETIFPIYYVDRYDGKNKENIQKYKFRNELYNQYILYILIDICIYEIINNSHKYILFTNPPSTMFYKKEKDIDSMSNMLKLINIHIRDYLNIKDDNKINFKKIYNININHFKHKKAQHIAGSRLIRLKDLDNRYTIDNKSKKYIKDNTKIIIMDDVSSSGGTLYSCKKTIDKYIENNNIKNTEIYLYSIAH